MLRITSIGFLILATASTHAIAADNSERNALVQAFVEGCHIASVTYNPDGVEHVDADQLHKASLCIAAVSSAMAVSRYAGEFEVAGVRLCVPWDAREIDVINRIVDIDRRAPGILDAHETSAESITLVIASLYRCPQ